LAAQAAVAIRNARLFMTSEKRRRAAEALADVGRLLTETLDPDVVGQRIADSIRVLLGAQTSALYRLEPESGDLVSVAVSSEVGPTLGRNVVFPRGTGAGGLAIREHRAVVSPDGLNDPRITLTLDSRSRIAAAGYSAVLAVPLIVRDSVIGALGVADRKGRMFDAEEIELAQVFAAHAALALENARIHEQTERRRKQAEVLASLARDIGASRDLRAVLQRIADSAREVAGADLASIALREPGSEAMVFAYLARADYRWRGQVRADPGKGVGGQVLLTGRPFRTDNYAEDPRISKDYLDVVRAEGIIAGLVVPIRVGDRIGGLLSVANRSPRPFTARDEAILERLADHAAIAIRNIQSFAHEQEARAAAEASEQRFRGLVQSLDAIVWEADAETCPRRFTFVSQRAETMLGYPAVRWVTEPGFWAGAIHPDDRERTVAACREGTAGKRDFHLEHRMVAVDGREVWLHDVVHVVRDMTGNALQRRGVMIDITERKRAEETAGALVQVARLLSESLDPRKVARRITETVRALLGAENSIVFQLEPQSGDLVSLALSGELQRVFDEGLVLPQGGGIAGACVRERGPVVTNDLLADPGIMLTPEVRTRLERASARSVLAVPLIVKDTLIGVLTVGARAGRVFDEEAIRLAQAFGDLAALALENARLFEESERRRRSTEALLEIARVLGSTLESKKILKVIAQQAARAVGATRCTMRFVLEKTLVPVMCQFADGHRDAALWAKFTAGNAGADEVPAYAEAMRTKHPVVIEDAEASDRIPRDWVEVFGARSLLVVPLIHKDEVIGVLNLDRTEGPYKWRRDQIDLAVTIVNQAALTIESAELHRRAEERAQRLTALAKLTGLIASARGSGKCAAPSPRAR
jgi:PAS domain S-box-containing protein